MPGYLALRPIHIESKGPNCCWPVLMHWTEHPLETLPCVLLVQSILLLQSPGDPTDLTASACLLTSLDNVSAHQAQCVQTDMHPTPPMDEQVPKSPPSQRGPLVPSLVDEQVSYPHLTSHSAAVVLDGYSTRNEADWRVGCPSI
jgi:hypothetical protein